jgi:hypothetical protein
MTFKKLFTTLLLLTNLSYYSLAQNLNWVSSFGSSDNDFVTSIVSDAQGNSYVTGNFRKTIQFDSNSGIPPLEYAGVLNSFIAKYDVNGKLIWAKKLGDSSGTYALVSSTSILSDNGSIYVTGEFQDKIDFDLGPAVAELSSYVNGNIFLAKYDTNGSYIWAINFGGGVNPNDNSAPKGLDLAVDENHNVFVTGAFAQTSDFNPGAETHTLINKGKTDAFIAKYDAAGKYIWAKGYGSTGSETGRTIEIQENTLYVGGIFSGIMDADPTSEVREFSSKGQTDFYLSKFDTDGNFTWSNAFGDVDYDYIQSISIDTEKNVFLTGSFRGTIDADPTSDIKVLTSNGNSDILIAKYTPEGTLAWAHNYGSTEYDFGNDIVVNVEGNILVTGSFGSSFDFDKSESNVILTSQGSTDIFIAKFDKLGNLVWADSFGGTSVDGGEAIALNKNNIIVGGRFAGTVQFDSKNTASKVIAKGANDVFAARFTDPTMSPITALPDVLADPTLKVFPNPAGNFVNIITEQNYNDYRLTVTDVYGKFFEPKTYITSNTVKLDLRNFARGIYFITVETKQHRTTKKVVLQ